MKSPSASIVMRSFNEGWALKETLPALKDQDYKEWELIVIDSGSTDGSQELIRSATPAHFIQITPAEYNPSKVMNRGMSLAKSETVLFLNADATPQGSGWLRPLAQALRDERVAACFGRQVPRPDCEAVFACDYERCFGPVRESASWGHFFSMVSSGLRKDIWSIRGFREDLQYAEDDEYTRWCLQQGYEVKYVPESVAMHSHNYSAAQCYKRALGDARAMARAGNTRLKKPGWSKVVLLGWMSDVRHDLRYCLAHSRLRELPHSLIIRWHQRKGKLAGIKRGMAERDQMHHGASPPAGHA